MGDNIILQYDVDGENFVSAGEASANVKKVLKQLGLPPEVIRRVAIAMYEGEINMVIHASGGQARVEISPEKVQISLEDHGPGIPDVELAMQEGYSTAPDSVRELGFGAGMGLPNIKKYTDELRITTEVGKGTTLDMSVHIK